MPQTVENTITHGTCAYACYAAMVAGLAGCGCNVQLMGKCMPGRLPNLPGPGEPNQHDSLHFDNHQADWQPAQADKSRDNGTA